MIDEIKQKCFPELCKLVLNYQKNKCAETLDPLEEFLNMYCIEFALFIDKEDKDRIFMEELCKDD